MLPPGPGLALGATETAAMASRSLAQVSLNPASGPRPAGADHAQRRGGFDAERPSLGRLVRDRLGDRRIVEAGRERRRVDGRDPGQGDEVRSLERALVLALLRGEQEVVVAPVRARIITPGAARGDGCIDRLLAQEREVAVHDPGDAGQHVGPLHRSAEDHRLESTVRALVVRPDLDRHRGRRGSDGRPVGRVRRWRGGRRGRRGRVPPTPPNATRLPPRSSAPASAAARYPRATDDPAPARRRRAGGHDRARSAPPRRARRRGRGSAARRRRLPAAASGSGSVIRENLVGACPKRTRTG